MHYTRLVLAGLACTRGNKRGRNYKLTVEGGGGGGGGLGEGTHNWVFMAFFEDIFNKL